MLNKVFVYGTLRPTQELYPHISHFKHTHKPATMQGVLHLVDVAWFPAMTIGGKHLVKGDLLTFDESVDMGNVLTVLDTVEGAPHLFKRIQYVTQDKEECYVYVGNNLVRTEWVRDGDFINFVPSQLEI